MSQSLSSYAFNRYWNDAALYNGIAEQEQTIKALREQLAQAEELRQAFVATINTAGDFLKRVLDEDGRERDELRSQRDRALSELTEARKALLVLMGQADLSTVKDCSSQVAVMVALFRAHLSQQTKECEAARVAIPENGVTIDTNKGEK